jgi:hypothetical protein
MLMLLLLRLRLRLRLLLCPGCCDGAGVLLHA